ncbi:MAG: hypothetical protein VXY92_00710 [Planctomycetota bacterium]|nr:hypothetical protein [Planctomycetota bacterium]
MKRGVAASQAASTAPPVSASLVAQAATLGNGVFHMSDAVSFQTWL